MPKPQFDCLQAGVVSDTGSELILFWDGVQIKALPVTCLVIVKVVVPSSGQCLDVKDVYIYLDVVVVDSC